MWEETRCGHRGVVTGHMVCWGGTVYVWEETRCGHRGVITEHMACWGGTVWEETRCGHRGVVTGHMACWGGTVWEETRCGHKVWLQDIWRVGEGLCGKGCGYIQQVKVRGMGLLKYSQF